MLLSKIDFNSLDCVTHPNRWGANTNRDRQLFRDKIYYYKIWGVDYIKTTLAAVGSEFIKIENLTNIHGFEVGLFDSDLCKAFVEFIFDENELLRGYITIRGSHPSVVPDEFIDLLFESSVNSGWVFSDLKEQNVVIVDGHCSLIDYDTHLTCLEKIDFSFEEKTGCLRSHVCPRYRSKIISFVKTQRQKLRAEP